METTKSKKPDNGQESIMHLTGLCLLEHLSENMKYAKMKVFGEEPQPLGGEFEHLIDSIFEEARCEHANAENIDRRQECNSCFVHVRDKVF